MASGFVQRDALSWTLIFLDVKKREAYLIPQITLSIFVMEISKWWVCLLYQLAKPVGVVWVTTLISADLY